MKKILALILALLLAMSSVAFAAVPENANTNTYTGRNYTDKSSLVVHSPTSNYTMDDGTTGEVDTELWMQVAANGQIDVTVPLVLVFSTNIDGGDATAADNYLITNNNTRNSISVDAIKVNMVDNNEMLLVSETTANAWESDVRNQYFVTLNPEFVTKTEGNSDQNEAPEAWYYDLQLATNEDTYNQTANKSHVLFQIGEGEQVDMNPYMKTTPLTFVTAELKENGEEDYSASKGIELLNIVYTVSLKYSYADGVKDITTEGESLTGTGTAIAHNHNT